MGAGIITLIIPSGTYDMVEQDGRLVIDPGSFHEVEKPDYPFWRWLIAPLEVLPGPDSTIIITIIILLILVDKSFADQDESAILKALVTRIVRRFRDRKYLLLQVISLFFMIIGAFFGIFAEVVPLVPLMLALSCLLGWNALVGLWVSVLAVDMYFSAAITNPFNICISQMIAGLPLFSDA